MQTLLSLLDTEITFCRLSWKNAMKRKTRGSFIYFVGIKHGNFGL